MHVFRVLSVDFTTPVASVVECVTLKGRYFYIFTKKLLSYFTKKRLKRKCQPIVCSLEEESKTAAAFQDQTTAGVYLMRGKTSAQRVSGEKMQ